LEVRIAPPHPLTGRFAELDRRRSDFIEEYASLLEADPRMRCRVLDVGCGCDFPTLEPIARLLRACRRLDGVDPLPCVVDHPGLTERWCGEFETAPIPDDTYDAVFTFFVAEHLRDAGRFFATAARVLVPGGVVHALTPHALHPFAMLSRAIQAVNVKDAWRRATRHKVNAYPAYYRANRLGSVVRAARRAGFTRAARRATARLLR
jgi:SAM-dependent methyltransferase